MHLKEINHVVFATDDMVKTPAEDDMTPLPIVAEDSQPQPGHWPEVTNPTPPEKMLCKEPSARYDSVGKFLRDGIVRHREVFAERESLQDATA